MSYDISFKVKVEGVDCFVTVGDCDANTTWNVRKMIEKSTGLEWLNEANNGFCKDVIPLIEKGYVELIKNPEAYRKYDSPNGWGTVESTARFFKNIIDAWYRFLKYEDKDLVDVVTFWIE